MRGRLARSEIIQGVETKTSDERQAAAVNTTTSLDRDQILNLCELIHTSRSGNLPVAGSRTLGLFRCIQVTLLTLRHNLTQELLADIHTVSQSTISRVITVYTPLIAEALQARVPGTGDLDPDRQYIIDGTLAPCWSWHDRPELYSGKHHTTGVNLQVACTLTGQLAWISKPSAGSVHDAKAIKESGFLEALDATTHIGDKGYIGLGMITPVKKPAHGELTNTDKRNNTTINRVRYLIERVIANVKTWRVLHTDYRRPYNTFETTIQAVTGLIFAYTP